MAEEEKEKGVGRKILETLLRAGSRLPQARPRVRGLNPTLNYGPPLRSRTAGPQNAIQARVAAGIDAKEAPDPVPLPGPVQEAGEAERTGLAVSEPVLFNAGLVTVQGKSTPAGRALFKSAQEKGQDLNQMVDYYARGFVDENLRVTEKGRIFEKIDRTNSLDSILAINDRTEGFRLYKEAESSGALDAWEDRMGLGAETGLEFLGQAAENFPSDFAEVLNLVKGVVPGGATFLDRLYRDSPLGYFGGITGAALKLAKGKLSTEEQAELALMKDEYLREGVFRTAASYSNGLIAAITHMEGARELFTDEQRLRAKYNYRKDQYDIDNMEAGEATAEVVGFGESVKEIIADDISFFDGKATAQEELQEVEIAKAKAGQSVQDAVAYLDQLDVVDPQNQPRAEQVRELMLPFSSIASPDVIGSVGLGSVISGAFKMGGKVSRLRKDLTDKKADLRRVDAQLQAAEGAQKKATAPAQAQLAPARLRAPSTADVAKLQTRRRKLDAEIAKLETRIGRIDGTVPGRVAGFIGSVGRSARSIPLRATGATASVTGRILQRLGNIVGPVAGAVVAGSAFGGAPLGYGVGLLAGRALGLGARGKALSRFGEKMSRVGQEFSRRRMAYPMFRKFAQEAKTNKLKQYHLGREAAYGLTVGLTAKFAKLWRDAFLGELPFSYVASGGFSQVGGNFLSQAAAESLLIEGPIIGAGKMVGRAAGMQLSGDVKEHNRLAYNAALNFRDQFLTDPDQRAAFDSLPPIVKRMYGNAFTNNPDLKIQFITDLEEGSGLYDPDSNTITINPNDPRGVETILAHEFRHHMDTQGFREAIIDAAVGPRGFLRATAATEPKQKLSREDVVESVLSQQTDDINALEREDIEQRIDGFIDEDVGKIEGVEGAESWVEVEVPLSDVEQSPAVLGEDRYAGMETEAPPILVSYRKDRGLVIFDGNNRAAAARKDGKTSITAFMTAKEYAAYQAAFSVADQTTGMGQLIPEFKEWAESYNQIRVESGRKPYDLNNPEELGEVVMEWSAYSSMDSVAAGLRNNVLIEWSRRHPWLRSFYDSLLGRFFRKDSLMNAGLLFDQNGNLATQPGLPGMKALKEHPALSARLERMMKDRAGIGLSAEELADFDDPDSKRKKPSPTAIRQGDTEALKEVQRDMIMDLKTDQQGNVIEVGGVAEIKPEPPPRELLPVLPDKDFDAPRVNEGRGTDNATDLTGALTAPADPGADIIPGEETKLIRRDENVEALKAHFREGYGYNDLQLGMIDDLIDMLSDPERRGEAVLGYYFPVWAKQRKKARKGDWKQYVPKKGIDAKWYRFVPYALVQTDVGNVIVKAINMDQVLRNAQTIAKSRKGLEAYQGDVSRLMDDFNEMVRNHGRNIQNAARFTPDKLALLNAVFGDVGRGHKEANLLLQKDPQIQKIRSAVRSFRIERFSQMNSGIKAGFPFSLEKTKAMEMPARDPQVDTPDALTVFPKGENLFQLRGTNVGFFTPNKDDALRSTKIATATTPEFDEMMEGQVIDPRTIVSQNTGLGVLLEAMPVDMQGTWRGKSIYEYSLNDLLLPTSDVFIGGRNLGTWQQEMKKRGFTGARAKGEDIAVVSIIPAFLEPGILDRAPGSIDARGYFSDLTKRLRQKVQGKAVPKQQILALLNPQKGLVKKDEAIWMQAEDLLETLEDRRTGKVNVESFLELLEAKGRLLFDEIVLQARDEAQTKVQEISSVEPHIKNPEFMELARKLPEGVPAGIIRAPKLFKEFTGNAPGDFGSTNVQTFELAVEPDSKFFVFPFVYEPVAGDRPLPSFHIARINRAGFLDVFDEKIRPTEVRKFLPFRNARKLGGNTNAEAVASLGRDFTTSNDAIAALKKMSEANQTYNVGPPPRWVDYTLPDGIRYAETILRLGPEIDGTGPNRITQLIRKSKMYSAANHFGRSLLGSDAFGYIAHHRTKVRFHEEQPGLFIEELQSDRHQIGRRRGYEKTEKLPETEGVDPEAQGPKVPHAPYKDTTAWVLALFKTALKQAVDQNMEWIGWTDGDTQNLRNGVPIEGSFNLIRYDGDTLMTEGGEGYNIDEYVDRNRLADHIGQTNADILLDRFNEDEQEFEDAVTEAANAAVESLSQERGLGERPELPPETELIPVSEQERANVRSAQNEWDLLQETIREEAYELAHESVVEDRGYPFAELDQEELIGIGTTDKGDPEAFRNFYDRTVVNVANKYLKKYKVRAQQEELIDVTRSEDGQTPLFWKVEITPQLRKDIKEKGQTRF